MNHFYLKTYGLSVLAFLFMQGLTAQPTITSFSPASGNIGTRVTITGTNFGATPTDNIVYFGAVRAIVSASTNISLTVTVPIGTTYQPITVTTGGLTAYSAAAFVVTFPGGFTKFSDSSFATGIDSITNNPLAAFSMADFDGDGKADLALSIGSLTNSVSEVLIFKNSSTPGKISLAAKMTYPRSATDAVPAINTIDVDGDGRIDLVVNDRGSSQILIYRNTSSGGTISFDNAVSIPNVYLVDAPFGMAIGDLNGDGKPDIVLANVFSDVSIFTNTTAAGNISFTKTTINGPAVVGVPLVIIGDIDGDNKADIIFGNGSMDKFDFSVIINVLRNTTSSGSLTFSNVTLANVGDNNSFTNGIAFGDLDGDGKPDIVASDSINNLVYIFKNTSSPGSPSLAAGIAYPAQGGVISIADMDGDGKADLAVSGNSGVSVLKNLSSPGTISFANKTDYLAGIRSSANCIGDIDGDGKPDLVIANAITPRISFLRNKIGESSFKPSGANPVTGDVVKTVTLDPTVQSYNGLTYVQRHYDIEPNINPATSTATITLYFTQTDFGNFNAAPTHGYNLPTGPTDAVGKSSMRIFQYHGFSTSSDPGGYTGSAVEIDPADNNIVWNPASALWEVTFDVTGFSGFFISSAASALPLKLLSFTATGQSNTALLKWTTNSEINTSYFDVQRGTDGGSFNSIGTINAAGNSGLMLNYQYTDGMGTDPVYYYRLKMVDKDAAFTYSDVVRVTPGNRHAALSFYPNPASDYVTVAHAATTHDTQLKLVDMTGKLVTVISVPKNSLQTTVQLNGLAHGAYKIVWNDGVHTFSQTLMVK